MVSAAKTYAIRMAAVFMISLATIWLKTGLMPRWLVAVSYLVALGLLIAGDVSMWLTLAFPIWVMIVSALILFRAGYIDKQRDGTPCIGPDRLGVGLVVASRSVDSVVLQWGDATLWRPGSAAAMLTGEFSECLSSSGCCR